MEAIPKDIFENITTYKQAHILKHYNILTTTQQKEFVEQLSLIDYKNIDGIFKSFQKEQTEEEIKTKEPIDDAQVYIPKDDFIKNKYRAIGLSAIAQGKGNFFNQVGVVILAGGQGSRLGFEHPKGMYYPGIPSKSTLFNIYCKKFLKIQELGIYITSISRTQ